MNEIKIFDSSIKFVSQKALNINGIPTITYYFTRLTKTSLLPIEITAILIGNKVQAYSPQLNKFSLEEDEAFFYYKNDIAFDKKQLKTKLLTISPIEKNNNSIEMYKNLFGVDLSEIKGINGLIFDKIVYVQDMPVENMSATSDGYIFVFTDQSSNKAKVGFYAGIIRPLKYNEYIERISGVGASNILNNIIISQKAGETIITNQNDLIVKIGVRSSDYDVKTLPYGVKEYTRKITELDPLILRPGQTISIPNATQQKELTYTLYSNPIHYINDTISTADPDTYIQQKDYIQYKPYEFYLKSAGLDIVGDDLSKFFIITPFTEVSNIEKAKKFIFNKEKDIQINIDSEFGTMKILSTEKLYNITSGGLFNLFVKSNKISTLLTLNENQYTLDYSFKGTENIVTQVSRQKVFNDVVSEYMESIVISIATVADYSEFENKNRKLKIEPLIKDKPRFAALPYLLKNEKFTDEIFLVDAFDICENKNRKSFAGYIFKSFNRELDSIIEHYLKEQKKAVSSYKFLDYDIEISTADIAQLSPSEDIWNVTEIKDSEKNDFTYSVKYHLDDLGYEIALNEALKKLKKVVYAYTPEKEVIATTNVGMTLDGKWYFCGSDFYRAEEIDNPKITTYIDDEIKEYLLNTDDENRFIYSKKVFFGYSNDVQQESETAKQLLLAIATGKSIDSDLLIQNPALNYIMSHLLDSASVTFPKYSDYIKYPVEFLFQPIKEDVKNKFVFPNIFKKNLYGDFCVSGIMSSAVKEEMAKVLLNNALDVLNSIVKIKINHSTYMVINTSVMKDFSSLFSKSGYRILGIECKKYGFNDIVKFEYSYVEDVIVGGYNYTNGYEIVLNGQKVFGIYYNYLTKKMHMSIDDDTIITDYSFVVSMLDALIHYNVNYLEGFKYKTLGEYRAVNEADEFIDEIQSKYLYSPQFNPVETDFKLIGVAVNYLNNSFFIDMVKGEKISETVKLGTYQEENGKEKEIKISIDVNYDENNLYLKKNGHSISVPLLSLTNIPTESTSYNAFNIIPFKIKRFIPLRHSDKFLKSVGIRVSIHDKVEYLFLEFAEIKFFEYNNETVYITLNGDGLQIYKKIGNHVSNIETIISIDDLFNGVREASLKDISVNILKFNGGTL